MIGTATAAVLLFFLVRTVVRLFQGNDIGISFAEFMLCIVVLLILWVINST